MRRQDLQAFLDRGWAAAAEEKQRWWRSRSPAEALRLADELRRSAQALRPDWPSEADRAADLAGHARLADLLRRVEANRQR